MGEYTEESTSAGKSRMLVWLDVITTGLWPVPLAMAVVGCALFIGAVSLDAMPWDQNFLRKWHLHSGTGDDARNLLSTLVTAIITMSSIVFSITIVALSLAANQFGSRLIRIYMSDVRTKLSLGLFTMTMVYCLMSLRSVNKDMGPAEVPHIAVTLGLFFSLMCVIVLLIFLHFVGRSIVADEIIRRVSRELDDNIDELPPLARAPVDRTEGRPLPSDFDQGSALICSKYQGYIEAIAYQGLTELCRKHDLYIRLDQRAGSFVCKGGWLGAVYPKQTLTEEIRNAVLDQIIIGTQRTPTQDVEYTLRHFVDIALRALSPGINDANTALVVIDHLSGAISRLMGKQLPSNIHVDTTGRVRVVGQATGYDGILAAAFHQIRQSAAPHPSVVLELLRALGRIGEQMWLEEQRAALLDHVDLMARAGVRGAQEPADRKDIESAHGRVREKLERMPLHKLSTVGPTSNESLTE